MESGTEDVSNTRCVVVFTNRGLQRMYREGGSQAWRMDAARASKCKYVICVQNRNATWGQPTANHKEAFLIAEIARIESSTESPDRQMIKFRSVAEISVPNMWDGNRNPVSYMTLGDFGIQTYEDLCNLKFNKLFNFPGPEVSTVSPGDDYAAAEDEADSAQHAVGSCSDGEEAPQALTIEQAKQGLALKFGLRIEQIEILIRA